jgi:hypothetical protein
MASQKQVDANRKNAQSSTGPRTIEGKSKSRLNALRDGLTGQMLTLSAEDLPIFEKLKSEMIADFNPKTITETKLAHAIAWDTWRLDHLRAIEMNMYSAGQAEAENTSEDHDNANANLDYAFADVRTFRAEASRLELMSLYEQRMTRNIHRNIGLLRDMQSERKRNYEHDKQEEVMIARICEINDMPIKASTAPSPNGFLFANEEIARAAVRHRYVETAKWTMKNGRPNLLYGGMQSGIGSDPLLEKLVDRRPVSAEEREQILSVPPETVAIHRVNHPEEYGLRES